MWPFKKQQKITKSPASLSVKEEKELYDFTETVKLWEGRIQVIFNDGLALYEEISEQPHVFDAYFFDDTHTYKYWVQGEALPPACPLRTLYKNRIEHNFCTTAGLALFADQYFPITSIKSIKLIDIKPRIETITYKKYKE